MQDQRLVKLFEEASRRGYTRRQIMERAAAMGLSVPALSVAMAAAAAAQGSPAAGATNPFGVDPAAPLDVVIFKGGYGDDYAKYVNTMYSALYPESQIAYQGIQRLGEQLQPRFIDGSPPDVIDNSGAGNLDTAALIAEGQLATLADVLAAPAYDSEGMTVGETLSQGTQDTGVFNGEQYYLNLVQFVTGIWYSSSFMTERGYTYPQTWQEMLDLSAELKGSGVAPWATTGVYPQYAQNFVFDQLVWKANPQALVDIDNLVEDAWRAPEVEAVLEALSQLGSNEYLLDGWEGLTHTESQAEWLQGRAAFLPCGSWLENEMTGLVPEGFDMVVSPVPPLEGSQVPFEGIFSGGGEVFIVPAEGANVAGGKEWLRLLLSKEAGRAFAEATKSLTVVQGAADGLDLGTAFQSVQQAIEAAGTNTFISRYSGWYKDLQDEAKNAMASLLQGQIEIAEYIDTAQEMADQVREDDAIPKYERSL